MIRKLVSTWKITLYVIYFGWLNSWLSTKFCDCWSWIRYCIRNLLHVKKYFIHYSGKENLWHIPSLQYCFQICYLRQNTYRFDSVHKFPYWIELWVLILLRIFLIFWGLQFLKARRGGTGSITASLEDLRIL